MHLLPTLDAEYCPPKLHVQGFVWAIMSLLGIATGAGG